MEQSFAKVTHNRNVKWQSQSYSKDKIPINQVKLDPGTTNYIGVTGQDVRIAIADTGLDSMNCYFADRLSTVQYPKQNVSRMESKTSTIPSAHRKVDTYVSYMDDVDSTHGHGTLLAGTAAGSFIAGNNAGWKAFDSQANGAKLVVIDIGCSGSRQCSCPDCDCARKNATRKNAAGHCAPDETRQTVHPPDDWYARYAAFHDHSQ